MSDFVELTALDDRKVLIRKGAILVVQANFAASRMNPGAKTLITIGGVQEGVKETVGEVMGKL
jgi:hypothetical protein